MIIIRTLLLLILFYSCNTEPVRENIEVNKTIKIEATNFPTSNNSYNYLWAKPKGPVEQSYVYKIENNKMLFTPKIEGDFNITLLVESFDHTKLYEETFLYFASGASEESEILNTDNDTEIKKEKKVVKLTSSYTIQVASWPTYEQARKDQLNLNDLGYDAYLEQFFIKSKNQTWWRVRVGHFTDKAKAEIIKEALSKIKGKDLWIDFITE